MNRYRNLPMFEVGGGDGAAQERFEFSQVSAKREEISTHTTTALGTLRSGSEVVNTAFGANGNAMRGGSSNFVNTKWNELTDKFVEFSNYIQGTLDKVQVASKTNEAFEGIVQEMFAAMNALDDGAAGGATPAAPATDTSSYYS